MRFTRLGAAPEDRAGTPNGKLISPPRGPALARRGFLALACSGPAHAGAFEAGLRDGSAEAPLFDGMGPYRVQDASTKPLARRYMAQGMVLAWGFNPAEAARSFAGALRHDPASAAAAWGLAWALGPTINADMAAADAPRVGDALQQARRLAASAPRRWQHLIAALALRHPPARQAGQTAVDEDAYARRMAQLARLHPHDADVLTLAAESRLNLNPYDWWTADGRAQPWTGETVALLQQALAADPQHPGALHLWVHLFETSPTPARASRQAERLRGLVPGSGHLLHMPAHIDMRLGRYGQAVAANQRAIAADLRYLRQVDAQGAYRVGYVAHNHHFLWAAAAMQGRSGLAVEAADGAYAAACGPSGADDGSGTLQHYRVLPLYARLRFGQWHALLHDTRPPEGAAPYPLAIWHHARGTALLRLGRAAEAREALARLLALADDPALAAARIKQVNPALALVRIASRTLQADLALHEGRWPEGLATLRDAVALEDTLQHDEPHLWLAPTRHALATALLAARQAREAEAVLRQDLRHYPANGWALTGLASALALQGRPADAQAVRQRALAAWRDADIALPPRPRL